MTAVELDPWSMPTYPERIARALPALQQVIAILTGTDSVSHGCSDQTRDNECAREQRANAAPDDLHSDRHYTEGGADLMMIAPSNQGHSRCRDRHAEDAAIIRRLRTDLARAIEQRDNLRRELTP